MSTDFERLNIILAARDREFQRAMDRNIRRIERFENRAQRGLSKTSRHFDLASVAARKLLLPLTALASLGALRSVVADLDNIGKTADKLGLTTDALQELRIAGESAGISTRTLDMAMQRYGRRLAEARRGQGEAVKAFQEMNIALVDADGRARSAEAVLGDVADRMAGMADQTDRNRIAMKLFDSEGVAMVNMLRNGSQGLEELRKAAREAGGVIEEDLIRGAEETQNRLDLLARAIKADLARALVRLAPLLELVVAGFAGLVDMGADVVEFIATLGGLLSNPAADDLQRSIDNVTLAMGDEILQSQALRAELGQGALMSRGAALRKLEEAQARRQNIAAMLEEARTQVEQSDRYRQLSAEIRQLHGEVLDLESVQQRAREAGKTLPGLTGDEKSYAGELTNLYTRLNVLLQERQAMLAQVDAGLAEGHQELVALNAAIAALEEAIENSTGGVVDMGDALVKPVELGERLSDTLAGVTVGGIDDAQALATYLGISLESATRLAALGPQGIPAAPAPVVGGRGGDPRQFGGGFKDWEFRDVTAFLAAYRPSAATTGSGSGGSGLSDAQKEENRLLAEGTRLTERLRTASERLADQKAYYKELLDAGAISQETFNRAMTAAAERLGEMSELASDVKDALIDFAMGGEDAFNRLGKAIERAGWELLLFGEGPLAVDGFNGILGGIFSTIFGAGRASGGDVRPGTIYPVNEHTANTEWFRPNVPGRIMTPAQIRGSLGAQGGARQVREIVEIRMRPEPGVIAEISRREAAGMVEAGLSEYDTALPQRVGQIRDDPRGRF